MRWLWSVEWCPVELPMVNRVVSHVRSLVSRMVTRWADHGQWKVQWCDADEVEHRGCQFVEVLHNLMWLTRPFSSAFAMIGHRMVDSTWCEKWNSAVNIAGTLFIDDDIDDKLCSISFLQQFRFPYDCWKRILNRSTHLILLYYIAYSKLCFCAIKVTISNSNSVYENKCVTKKHCFHLIGSIYQVIWK